MLRLSQASREILDLDLLQLGLCAERVRDAQAHDERLLAMHAVGDVQLLRGVPCAHRRQRGSRCRIELELHELWHCRLQTSMAKP